MGWLCCIGTGDRPAAVREPPPPPQKIASINAIDGVALESSSNACCVFSVTTPSASASDRTIVVQGGKGALASAPGPQSLLLDLVAVNSTCFDKLSLSQPSIELASIALLKLVGESGLFWIALSHAVSKGDAAGHLAVALPNGQVLVIRACTWEARLGIIVEWQQPSFDVQPRNLSKQQQQHHVAEQQQMTASSSPEVLETRLRAHDLLNDERFPAALT